MTSSPGPLPLAWIDTDLTLPPVPNISLRKSNRHHKRTKQISKLLYQRPTPNNPPSSSIPDLQANVNPSLVFGRQVSNLTLRDTAMLQAESLSEPESPDSTILQRKRALQHAKLVTEQMGQRSNKRCHLNEKQKSPREKAETFRFTDLPSEIRDMIYWFYFTSSSGEKPRLMWAFMINGRKVRGNFYSAAEMVYYTVNNWTFNIKECRRNSILGNMDQYHVEMLRKMTIEIPKAIQPCTKFSSAILKAVNIDDLTLSVRSETGIRRAILEILPAFKHLRKLTISIHRLSWDIRTSHRDERRAIEYYKIFGPVCDMLDRVLSHQGVLVQDTIKVQEWAWEIDSSGGRAKAFNITCPKHIKFE